jgi:hypothetical protein
MHHLFIANIVLEKRRYKDKSNKIIMAIRNLN